MSLRPARPFLPLAVLAALLCSALTLLVPARAAAVADTACGAPLAPATVAEIADLADTTEVADPATGSSLDRLERAVERHRRITEILVEHRDRRGLLALGLDTVEQTAVMPLQRTPAAFDDPEWAHRISLDLLLRFLRNLHAEFTGGPTEPQWTHYFALTRRCELSAARVAMAGYNAHLSVDLANAVAATRATPADARDYFTIVDAIASHGFLIVDATKAIYGGDLGPLWRFYFVGEGLDAVLGAGVATGPLLRLADAGANVVIFGNGLALQDPALEPAVRAEIDVLWRSADAAFEVLAAVGGL
ncbi:hypothetical protein IU436_07825 [Nocardia farcinica]|uniref:Uncharacterized protein n=1 Tax=Nocardia farcinica TaxID=37329 RepID=A0A0H5P199_NOCFR|nr:MULTISPECIES: DUF5995 family protein [Nocardia]AXK85095.1 hypothetical protein DXT66_05145 [Nocardia farcinica]MBA4855506.1 hypothetical protein [Nocardia farcinica]MBC9818155.1 hypothetical protein [Nocardia farcinica]MBF6184592.1 hypothetical protein [Nocardia farcinica]MBF6249885.1 hypothetical protein [Nocardia farcinica]